jgi:hypothetical protein
MRAIGASKEINFYATTIGIRLQSERIDQRILHFFLKAE